ncbi:Signal peptidase I-like protein [Halorhabdus utahensis DSM 12940]|uniref:Signal peptidase I-like protein n=1 Tax=Halorhabdus utahensis (strain DSM 12940 / JCM 11049 / AX-2) TaxID=519442 RepID=C7NQ42_HALUD|nr:Signal peptidase I-like protein [Halorhabdus utahensis DSM 12940]
MSDPSDDRDPPDRERDRREPAPDTPSEPGDDDDDSAGNGGVADRDEQSAQDQPSAGRRERDSTHSPPEDRTAGTRSPLEETEPSNQPPSGDRDHRGADSDQTGAATGRDVAERHPPSIDRERRKPPQRRGSASGSDSWLTRVFQYTFDIASSVLIVVLIGALLFATSGVWPPLVAIESPSMEPNIDTGDLVFVMEEHRFSGPGATEESGIVPARAGQETNYRMFNGYGDVIIYQPDGNGEATPIIHRAMFWVAAEENWYDRGDPAAIGNADNCEELANCPAPHAGFITKGDNNRYYDQVGNQFSGPVKPEWIIGTAEYNVPGLGRVRLLTGEAQSRYGTVAKDAEHVTAGTTVTAATNGTESVDFPSIAP